VLYSVIQFGFFLACYFACSVGCVTDCYNGVNKLIKSVRNACCVSRAKNNSAAIETPSVTYSTNTNNRYNWIQKPSVSISQPPSLPPNQPAATELPSLGSHGHSDSFVPKPNGSWPSNLDYVLDAKNETGTSAHLERDMNKY
jgi:hypothetical protein